MGSGMCFEAHQLRVLTVAAGLPEQDLSRKQPFAPKRYQAFGIQIGRVQAP